MKDDFPTGFERNSMMRECDTLEGTEKWQRKGKRDTHTERER